MACLFAATSPEEDPGTNRRRRLQPGKERRMMRRRSPIDQHGVPRVPLGQCHLLSTRTALPTVNASPLKLAHLGVFLQATSSPGWNPQPVVAG
jgi:hypothetical protein